MDSAPWTHSSVKASASATRMKPIFGFPKKDGSSVSDWLRDAQKDPIFNHRTTPELPSRADVIIIGSGMSGTLIAKHYIETWPEKEVVVLEARGFCSGATGRNAGHCKPDQYRGFPGYEATFGTDQALKILQNEQRTWSQVVAYVRENNVDCDLWVGHTLDVPVTTDAANAAKAAFERVKSVGGKIDHIKVTHDATEAAKISRIKDAKACYAWPASTLHPWKLAAHVMRGALKKGVNLQTHTQVTQVIQSSHTPGNWVVQSERGDIECSQVVHATNAYSSALEPSLRGLIRPTPHICNRVVPPVSFTGSDALKNSYGVLLPEGGLFSINPRITLGGPVLFGGSNPGQQKFGKWIDEHPERCVDDSLTSFSSIAEEVQKFAESQLIGWRSSSSGNADDYNHGWSGIIALSADNVPFVGQLPGLPGQWLCAGHNGQLLVADLINTWLNKHYSGMARIFTAAPGLVKLMGGSSWSETELPEVFEITPLRMKDLYTRPMNSVL